MMAVLLIFGLIFLAHLIDQPVIDWDEEVYLYLSKHMSWTFQGYTTRGSHIERELPQAYYRSTLFHHPPLVPLTIKMLSFMGYLGAAKLINLILWGISVFLVYDIARKFTDLKGGILALAFWLVCPIMNLEARLVHLDFPSTVLTLLGIWCFLKYQNQVPQRIYLVCSGVAFALAMLTKYTGPLLVVVPALLFITSRAGPKDWKAWAIYCGTVSLGFVWWLYVYERFGSLMPPGFNGENLNQHVTPYLKSISKRQWYDLWIYFMAICPLFLVYIGGAAKSLYDWMRKGRIFLDKSNNTRPLISANVGIWTFVLVFSLINSRTNGYWVFRHIMPVFPIIYISLGVICSRMLDKNQELIASFLLVFVLLSLVTMTSSTAITGIEFQNLKPIPISLFWLKMGHLFH